MDFGTEPGSRLQDNLHGVELRIFLRREQVMRRELILVSPSELDATHLNSLHLPFYRSFLVNKAIRIHRPVASSSILSYWLNVKKSLFHVLYRGSQSCSIWITGPETVVRDGIRNLIVSWSLNYLPNYVSNFFI